MIQFLLFMFIATNCFGQSVAAYDAQIKTIKDQREAMIADWKANDSDIKLIERIKAKNAQQRALADQMETLRKSRNDRAVIEGRPALNSYAVLDDVVKAEVQELQPEPPAVTGFEPKPDLP